MPDRPPNGRNAAMLGTIGVAAFAIVCCAGLPLLVGLAGSVAVGTLIGGAAGVVLAALVVSAAVIRWRARRASCRTQGEVKGS